jgi:hypothetical protein
MLPLLSLHALASQRGDGLRPELRALFERHAEIVTGLAATSEPLEQVSLCQVTDAVLGKDLELHSGVRRVKRNRLTGKPHLT